MDKGKQKEERNLADIGAEMKSWTRVHTTDWVCTLPQCSFVKKMIPIGAMMDPGAQLCGFFERMAQTGLVAEMGKGVRLCI